jgi:hypothetical protein
MVYWVLVARCKVRDGCGTIWRCGTRTASRRGSTTDKTTSANPSHHQSRTPHGDVPPRVPITADVADQLTDVRRTPAGALGQVIPDCAPTSSAESGS